MSFPWAMIDVFFKSGKDFMRAPPMQGDEIEDWDRDAEALISKALTAAEARGYERGIAEGREKLENHRKRANDNWVGIDRLKVEIETAETKGFLRCREEAAKVADKIEKHHEHRRTYCDATAEYAAARIAATIRSLKP